MIPRYDEDVQVCSLTYAVHDAKSGVKVTLEISRRADSEEDYSAMVARWASTEEESSVSCEIKTVTKGFQGAVADPGS